MCTRHANSDIFDFLNFDCLIWKIYNLKCKRSTTKGCKNGMIRKLEFEASYKKMIHDSSRSKK